MKEYIITDEDIEDIYKYEGITYGLEKSEELIRCKDCKHYERETKETVSWCRRFGLKGLPEDAYCFKAERKEK